MWKREVSSIPIVPIRKTGLIWCIVVVFRVNTVIKVRRMVMGTAAAKKKLTIENNTDYSGSRGFYTVDGGPFELPPA